jgi:hypothetical protein
MGHWNYRICKETHDTKVVGKSVSYSIREVYYNKDGSIWAVTEKAVGVGADRFTSETDETEEWALKEMTESLNKMKEAFLHPIIDLDTLVFAAKEER